MNFLHKFDLTLQPVAIAAQTANLGEKRKTSQIPHPALNKILSLAKSKPNKSLTSNVGPNVMPATSNFDCFSRGFLCRKNINANTSHTQPTTDEVHQLNGSILDHSSTTFRAANNTQNLPNSLNSIPFAQVPNISFITPSSKLNHGHSSHYSNLSVEESSNSTAKVPTRRTNIANDAEYYKKTPIHCNTATQTNGNGNETSSESDSNQSDHTSDLGNTTDEDFEINHHNDRNGMLGHTTHILIYIYVFLNY